MSESMDRPIRWLSVLALSLAILAGLATAMAVLGYRLEWWDFGGAMSCLRWGLILALGGLLAGLVTLGVSLFRWHVSGLASGLVASLLALSVAWPMVDGIIKARTLPAIHDISTDLDEPPPFEAVIALREGAPNPPDYPGVEVADQQRQAWPELGPLITGMSPDSAFQAALQTAADMHWEIVAADPQRGRIEAVDTTLWFGFKDDVVIRIRPDNDGSRIDLRSKSRVGRSDLGTNAARIKNYQQRLDNLLSD